MEDLGAEAAIEYTPRVESRQNYRCCVDVGRHGTAWRGHRWCLIEHGLVGERGGRRNGGWDEAIGGVCLRMLWSAKSREKEGRVKG